MLVAFTSIDITSLQFAGHAAAGPASSPCAAGETRRRVQRLEKRTAALSLAFIIVRGCQKSNSHDQPENKKCRKLSRWQPPGGLTCPSGGDILEPVSRKLRWKDAQGTLLIVGPAVTGRRRRPGFACPRQGRRAQSFRFLLSRRQDLAGGRYRPRCLPDGRGAPGRRPAVRFCFLTARVYRDHPECR